jgi:hypothetical protein
MLNGEAEMAIREHPRNIYIEKYGMNISFVRHKSILKTETAQLWFIFTVKYCMQKLRK